MRCKYCDPVTNEKLALSSPDHPLALTDTGAPGECEQSDNNNNNNNSITESGPGTP